LQKCLFVQNLTFPRSSTIIHFQGFDTMNGMQYDKQDKPEELDETEKLDQDLHDAEMLYRSRCVDVPLTSNVTVKDLDKEEKKDNDSQAAK
jgi:hypothetical protein